MAIQKANRTENTTRSPCYVNDDNAYSNVLLTQSGRVYSVYNMNMKNITTLAGKHISRVDELGSFVMRYSDVSTASHTRGAVVAVAAMVVMAVTPAAVSASRPQGPEKQ